MSLPSSLREKGIAEKRKGFGSGSVAKSFGSVFPYCSGFFFFYYRQKRVKE